MLTHTAPSAERIRVVVVDDHDAVRTALKRVLEASPDFEAVSALASDRRLFTLLGRRHVDVVVLDHDREQSDGLTSCVRIKRRRDPPPVLIYSGYATPVLRLAAAAAQADAIVDKAEPVGVLLDAIRRLRSGERLLEPPPPDLLRAAAARLEAADVPVLSLLVEGRHPLDIAKQLGVGEDEIARRARRIVRVLQNGRAS
jgi:two-component system, NarL family, response regulator DesR